MRLGLTHFLNPATGLYDRRAWVKWPWVQRLVRWRHERAMARLCAKRPAERVEGR